MLLRLVLLIPVLTACRGDAEREPTTRSPDYRASYTGSLDRTLPAASELTVSAGVELGDAVRSKLEAQLRAALPEALSCMEGIYGTGWVDVELDASGKVTLAAMRSEGLLAGTPIGTCIETAIKKLQLGPVQGAPIRIGYPVRNMPSADQVREAAGIIKQAL